MLENFSDFPYLAQYEEWLRKDSYNIFNKAHNVLCIYGSTASHWHVYDATLCAANIMLAAHAQGMGTCWIGFAESFMDRPEIKARYSVPETFRLVSVLSIGYAKGQMPEAAREAPRLFNR